MTAIGSFLNLNNIQKARRALESDGHLVIEDGYDEAACSSMIEFMDAHQPGERVEVNYSGTELRIWDAQKRDAVLEQFYHECNVFASCLYQRDMEAFTLLAIRNKALSPDDVRSFKGRWHIDSFRRQLKIFLFLTDTTESSGPFEFIPRTHKTGFKLRMLCTGSFLKPSDLLGQTRTYQTLNEDLLDRLSAEGYRPLPVICRAGTILVIDTSAIHRARPCLQAGRYALTAYYK